MRHLLVALGLIGLVGLTAGGLACESDSGCKVDYDCPGAQVCRVSSGSCVELECEQDSDCSNGQTCVEYLCE
ncbi:MAG: hypothetical protein H6745_26800 [Deltaproteobacteria bacterium]|nr:hypothetical protein [Deltaproteobacteria bacterium]